MKTVLFTLFLFCCINSNAQIAVTPKIGIVNHNAFIGAEVQFSNLAPFAAWTFPGTYFGLNAYLWPYQSSWFTSIGIITHGRYQISDVTGKQKRSMPILIGYRWYKEGFSADLSTGIDWQEKGIRWCVQASLKYTFRKYK